MEGRDRILILRHYPGIRLERLRKITETLDQDSRSPGRDLNLGPTDNDAGVLTTRPRRSIITCYQEQASKCVQDSLQGNLNDIYQYLLILKGGN
jgi:hypothetical protein